MRSNKKHCPTCGEGMVKNGKDKCGHQRWICCSCKVTEVPRVLFLGTCLDFYYFMAGVAVPKLLFNLSRCTVAQALVKS
ncbi:IS1/IS1595 family N-terminal zinc-binding domain-containing protein [Arcanobacterium phocae]|uniref:IS1/IS1595 family N-terminal zinc-binding domain-containing protein n=1 Tax=Arcanobacterium phocae TaxID=131112 RepID=UPI003F4F8465